MKSYRKIAVALAVCGIVSLGTSSYISSEVGEGKQKIARGQQQTNQARTLLNVVQPGIGEGVAAIAQGKIGKGKQEVAYYEKMANILKIIGVIAIGAALLLYFRP